MAAAAFLLTTVQDRAREVRRAMKVSSEVYIPELIVSFEACFFLEVGTFDLIDSCDSALHALSNFHFPVPLPGIEIETSNPLAFDVLQQSSIFTKLAVNTNHRSHIRRLSELLAHTTAIRQLWIMNQNLQDSVAMLLFEGLMKNRGVLHLNLSNNNLSSKIAKILCKWLRKSPLIGLDVSYNSFGDEGIQELMDVVRNHKSLRLLRIGDNDINLLGIECICNCFKENSVLKDLDISGLAISSCGWALLSETMKDNDTLRHLGLEGTHLSNKDFEVLAKGLEIHPKLEVLNLSENKLSNEIAPVLKKLLMCNATLRYIDLGYNRMTNAIVQSFREKRRWALNPDINLAFDYWNS